MYRWQRTKRRSSRLQAVALALAMGTAAGCATQQTADKGEEAVRHRNWDAAVYYYLQAVAENPDNVQYRLELIRARQRAAQEMIDTAKAMRKFVEAGKDYMATTSPACQHAAVVKAMRLKDDWLANLPPEGVRAMCD